MRHGIHDAFTYSLWLPHLAQGRTTSVLLHYFFTVAATEIRLECNAHSDRPLISLLGSYVDDVCHRVCLLFSTHISATLLADLVCWTVKGMHTHQKMRAGAQGRERSAAEQPARMKSHNRLRSAVRPDNKEDDTRPPRSNCVATRQHHRPKLGTSVDGVTDTSDCIDRTVPLSSVRPPLLQGSQKGLAQACQPWHCTFPGTRSLLALVPKTNRPKIFMGDAGTTTIVLKTKYWSR
jgi:hypothetical protein